MARAEQLITENLGLWSAAVKAKTSAGRGSRKKLELYGIAKLRELILELAIRGMLVPQDTREDPASTLIQKIQQEKELLTKEGKIKKSSLKYHSGHWETPFRAPLGWEWAPLGMIGNIFNGNSINSRTKAEMYTRTVGRPFIATKDIGYGFEPIKYDNGVAIPTNEKNFKTAKKGSILICAEGGSAGRKCGITDREICFGNKLFANELYGGIEPKFILSVYLSPTFFAEFSEKTTGIIGGISSLKFNQLLCPLPPLAEQFRIVAKVDELMAICDQLEEEQENNLETHETLISTLLNALTSAAADASQFANAWQRIQDNFDILFTTESSVDQLEQTILQLAVMGKLVEQDPGDETSEELASNIKEEKEKLLQEGLIRKTKPLPALGNDDIVFKLPSTWSWHQLGNLTSIIGDGIHGTPEYDPSGDYFFVNGNNLTNGVIEIKQETKKVSYSEYKKHSKPLGQATVLVSINGSIGRTAFYNKEKIVLGKSACYFNLLGSIERHYIKILLQSQYFLDYAFARATGSTIKNVSLKAMREFPVPLPPLAEQKRIVAKIDELMALCDQIKTSLASAQETQLILADSIVEQAIHSTA